MQADHKYIAAQLDSQVISFGKSDGIYKKHPKNVIPEFSKEQVKRWHDQMGDPSKEFFTVSA